MIDIILMQRVEKLGQMGDVVKVKPGYARNFLLPQGKALRANKLNLEKFETEKTQREADNLSRRSDAETEAGKMEGLAVSMVRAASEMGQRLRMALPYPRACWTRTLGTHIRCDNCNASPRISACSTPEDSLLKRATSCNRTSSGW